VLDSDPVQEVELEFHPKYPDSSDGYAGQPVSFSNSNTEVCSIISSDSATDSGGKAHCTVHTVYNTTGTATITCTPTGNNYAGPTARVVLTIAP